MLEKKFVESEKKEQAECKELMSELDNKTSEISQHRLAGFLKGTVFFALLFLLLYILQQFIITRWNYPDVAENIYSQVNPFLNQNEDVEQVLFLGTSHMERGISPMLLYENDKIVSYNLGTSTQPIEGSYYLLKSALKKQSPEVVVLDVSNLFFSVDGGKYLDKGLRYLIDSMPLSREKVDLSKIYASMRLEKVEMFDTTSSTNQRFLNCIFPLIQYHSRWNELSVNDFIYVFRNKGWHYAGGYNLDSAMLAGNVSLEQMNTEAGIMDGNDTAHLISYENGKRTESKEKDVLYRSQIPKTNMEWLHRIKRLCEENDAELLLIKIPSVNSITVQTSSWTEARSDAVKQLSTELGVPFIDYLYDEQIGIDFITDTIDGGTHLNYNGVKKMSAAIGAYLKSHYNLSKSNCDFYDDSLNMYDQLASVVELEMSTDFVDYCTRLKKNAEDYLVLISVESDMKSNLSEDQITALSNLGLQTDFDNEVRSNDSWLAVIDGGKVKYEAASNHRISYPFVADTGMNITVNSVGRYAKNESARPSMFDIDGLSYYGIQSKGINFLIIDKTSEVIIDYISFNTSDQPGAIGKRGVTNDKTVNDYLRTYELWYILHPEALK